MDPEEVYEERAVVVAEPSLDPNDQNVSPAWGWFVAITPPTDFYIKQHHPTTKNGQDEFRKR